MGATRKLQGEIDRVLKKVQEGVDVFDSIWNKVYDTENANQKEKFEADLKKEIKKLQRYRDQIKTWIQSSEIKDKKSLLDARKLIEREMERFKVCEKETKTKAFSKEGLGQQPKTDPKEKAKGESRDWLNNMVSELESQIDSCEAEMEGLQVKKGKARPPRLTHLEDLITRHKLHIQKLELILRLLDNDELSPEQVNDVKDFVEDYVERNQDNFEEFADVDEIYQSLPLDKLEALENLDAIPIVPPAIVVKEKVVASVIVGVGASPPASPSSQSQILEDSATSEASAESPRAQTPSVPLLGNSPTSGLIPGPQDIGPGAATAVASMTATTPSHGSGNPTNLGILPSAAVVRPLPVKPSSMATTLEHTTVSLLGRTNEEQGGITGYRTGPSITDGDLVRSVSRGSGVSIHSPPHVSLGIVGGSLGSNLHSGASPPVLDLNKRLGLVGGEDRLGTGLSQESASSLGAQSQPFAATGAKLGETGGSTVDGAEGNHSGGRIFAPPGISGGQWRPHTASTLKAQQAELVQGQFHGRTEIAPDQKQKFLQQLQQIQQGHGTVATLLGARGSSQIPHLAAPMPKQPLGSQQQPAFLQQAQIQSLQQQQQQHNSTLLPTQMVSMPQQQPPLGVVTSPQALSPASTPPIPPQNSQLPTPQSSAHQIPRQLSLSSTTSSSENETGVRAVEQAVQQISPQQTKPLEETNSDASVLSAVFARNVSLSEDDLKNADTFDVSIGGPGTLAEFSQLSRDADFAPGQVVSSLQQRSPGPGLIGRRSTSDLGAIGDNLSPALGGGNASGQHDQLFNSQALEAAYRKLPLPKDSERPRSYIPRNPAATPSSYPQAQAPIVDNPALWERMDTDVLFFAFYYQQGTYQQYLAARELKKQSWRYHKKYNTWFQRHEEPKITTDEYEQGTYVYFDFHIVHDDFQQGWCQRIKTEFTFEYSYLEDELVI